MHFEQNGASSHYAVKVRQILDEKQSGRWLGRRGAIEWQLRARTELLASIGTSLT